MTGKSSAPTSFSLVRETALDSEARVSMPAQCGSP